METTGRKSEGEGFIVEGRRIGKGAPPFIIAEISANHNGSIERAFQLIDAAAAAGADAIKLQTYRADTITIDADGPDFILNGGLWDGRRLYDLYEEAHTPWEWHADLFARIRSAGAIPFSSPFDATAVDLLIELDCPIYKIASFEIVDLPLISRCAATGKPLVMSTGMATLGEIDEAVTAARNAGCNDLLLLHCTSGYPTPIAEADLRTIPNLWETFQVPVGLSDHTMGLAAPVTAVALGAVAIEKHFTLARADGGPDAAFSLEPAEFKAMADACREAYVSLGTVRHSLSPSEKKNRNLRRSLFVVQDIEKGETISEAKVRSIRPGTGLAPRHLPEVIGRKARETLRRGLPLQWSHLE